MKKFNFIEKLRYEKNNKLFEELKGQVFEEHLDLRDNYKHELSETGNLTIEWKLNHLNYFLDIVRDVKNDDPFWKMAGLLHDIGRLKQAEIAMSEGRAATMFDDRLRPEVAHQFLGVKEFLENPKYRKVIGQMDPTWLHPLIYAAGFHGIPASKVTDKFIGTYPMCTRSGYNKFKDVIEEATKIDDIANTLGMLDYLLYEQKTDAKGGAKKLVDEGREAEVNIVNKDIEKAFFNAVKGDKGAPGVVLTPATYGAFAITLPLGLVSKLDFYAIKAINSSKMFGDWAKDVLSFTDEGFRLKAGCFLDEINGLIEKHVGNISNEKDFKSEEFAEGLKLIVEEYNKEPEKEEEKTEDNLVTEQVNIECANSEIVKEVVSVEKLFANEEEREDIIQEEYDVQEEPIEVKEWIERQ